jgi:DNA-binding transcriptional LysR family regulator
MHEPAETSELLAFAKIVEAKSLSRAAAELSVPRATISRRLARLEERLDVRLLRRTTRSLTLTDAGEAFYRHARIALDAVARAEDSVRRTDTHMRGTLRVAMPPINEPSLDALVCDFAKRHPDVNVQLSFSTRYVDLQREGYDLALRAGGQLEPGLVARTISRAPLIAIASPQYLQAQGTPHTARELRAHRCILGFARGELPQTHWPLVGGGQLHVEGVFSSNEPHLLFNAALRGLGIALLPQFFVAHAIRGGKLVQVLPGVVEGDSRLSVVHLEREFVPPQVRAFIDELVAWATKEALGFEVKCEEKAAKTKSIKPKRASRPVRRSRA